MNRWAFSSQWAKTATNGNDIDFGTREGRRDHLIIITETRTGEVAGFQMTPSVTDENVAHRFRSTVA